MDKVLWLLEELRDQRRKGASAFPGNAGDGIASSLVLSVEERIEEEKKRIRKSVRESRLTAAHS